MSKKEKIVKEELLATVVNSSKFYEKTMVFQNGDV